MEFEFWHIWFLIALLAFILEIFVPSFVLFNFGIGAIAGALAAAFQLSVEAQILFFSAGTLISFALIRPAMKRFAYRRSANYKSNAEGMIGRVAQVTQEIDNENNQGLITLDGDSWQARSLSNELIPQGSSVEIVQINSIILIVKTTKNKNQ